MTQLSELNQEGLKHQLLKRPSLVEPGLLLQPELIPLGNGSSIPLHGMDMLGRPCLIGMFQNMDAAAFSWVMEAAIAFRDGLPGSDPIYFRGREPRLFLLVQQLNSTDQARFRLLADAVPLRVYQLTAPGEPELEVNLEDADSNDWALQLAFPPPDPLQQHPWWQDLHDRDQPCLMRLMAAANRGEPQIAVQGQPWPVLFSGPQGPFAALHQSKDGMLMVVEESKFATAQVLDLNDGAEQDQAVDSILRNRKNSRRLFVTK